MGGALLRAFSLELLGQLCGLLPDLHLLPHVLIQVPTGSDILSENFPIVIQSVSLIVTERPISKVGVIMNDLRLGRKVFTISDPTLGRFY